MTTVVAAPAIRMGSWLADPGFGVYVHIPFCVHRCHYCDFNTYEGQDELHEVYVEALVRDITRAGNVDRPATSVFFGGGTPTLLEPSALERVLTAIRDRIGIEPGAEITIEANPETVDPGRLAALAATGFNRLSVGVQSLVPAVLRGLGRTHSPERALEALAAAHDAGFADVNADLIYGSPWGRPHDWIASVRGVLAAEPDHVSAYALTIEQGTPLATLIRTGRERDVDPDVQAERYEVVHGMLSAAGYGRYEISNWARPGRASQHNVLYWSGGNYLGFGAGAHGHLDGRRSWTTRRPRDFIGAVARGETTQTGYELISGDERASEALMLGLRLDSGIDLDAFAARFGREALAARSELIAELTERKLVHVSNGWLKLSDRARFVANEVLCALLS